MTKDAIEADQREKHIAKITELANKIALKNPDLNILRPEYMDEYSSIVRIIQDHIKSYDKRSKLILPNLAAFGNETVAIFSDYAGEGSGDHDAYSFLVCAWNTSGQFSERIQVIRKAHSLGDKEFEFKDFRMGQMQRALPEYLKAADTYLHGFLFTIVVDKALISLFGPNEKASLQNLSKILASNGLGNWKPNVAEKLVRVVHTIGFLIGLLAESGQKIFWMTDNDSICANEDLHKSALELLARAVKIYTDDECKFPVFGGGPPFKERSLEFLDLLSLADITASSLEHYLTRQNMTAPDKLTVKGGSQHVLQWLANDGISLSKMIIVIRPTEDGQIGASTLQIELTDPPSDAIIIPIVV